MRSRLTAVHLERRIQHADKEQTEKISPRESIAWFLPGAPSANHAIRRASGDRRLRCADCSVHESASMAHRTHLVVLRTVAEGSPARLPNLFGRVSLLLQLLLRALRYSNRSRQTRHSLAAHGQGHARL